MLRAIATRTTLPVTSRRCFATIVPVTKAIPGSFVEPPAPALDTTFDRKPAEGEPGALRPTWDVPVDPKHGLYAFFRKAPAQTLGEMDQRVLLERTPPEVVGSGRPWKVSELRRKSFQDLHIIWYQCQRELNLLETMYYNFGRFHVESPSARDPLELKKRMCQKTCARIKLVLNERRLAFDEATERVRWDHRPGHKEPGLNPFLKGIEEKSQRAARKEYVRVQYAQLRERVHRRQLRRKAAFKKRAAAHKVASQENPPSETSIPETNAPTDVASTSSVPISAAPTKTRVKRPIPGRVIRLLRVKPMSQNLLNKRLHRIKDRKRLPPSLKSHLHLTLKWHKMGNIPRPNRTYDSTFDDM